MTASLPPFEPYRRALYSHADLLSEFDSGDPRTFAETTDFRIYRHYKKLGGAECSDYFTTMMQALHDNSITQAIRTLLAGRRCAAIMGGHKMARNRPEYREVALLARELTRRGFIAASGGGPGAMEATHLGASFESGSERDLDEAIERLSKAAELPKTLGNLLTPDGEPDAEACAEAHRWYAPAVDIARELMVAHASLAIPTWHYGHEPSTPLASHIGKYFQNSIREDGLLSFAMEGVVFTEGRAGTIQEIFQDAAQNFYRSVRGRFSPMVFLGLDFWTNHYPVNTVLRSLFEQEDYQKYVLFTDSPEAAVDFLCASH